jgi:hypothetical protein
MTALAGTKYSVGYVVDTLIQASFTLYMGNLALQGLSKIAVVARRGVNEALKMCYFDTSKSDSLVGKAAAFIPTKVSNFFKDDSGYNATHFVERDVPVLGKDGKPEMLGEKQKTEKKDVEEYVNGNVTLAVSGLGLSLFALIMLDAKETLWKPAHPILNGVLQYISPVQAVLGQSWVAQGIHHMVGAARSTLN